MNLGLLPQVGARLAATQTVTRTPKILRVASCESPAVAAVIACYYVNCPTLYFPVRVGRVSRWLNLRKLGGVGFAPYHECGWI